MVEIGGKPVSTGILKAPSEARIALRGVNLDGDDQADRTVHGGPDQAVYAYASEDYAWWSDVLGRPLPPGTFGENMTTAGIDVSGAKAGERWRVGSAVLQVTIPRLPCYKLAWVMSDPAFVKTFARALRPGAYFSVISEGDMAAGDAIEVFERPDHGVTIAEMAKIFLFEHARAHELLSARYLPASWHDWIAGLPST
jgi:MOSC domain-containing protein YiiM